MKRAIKYVAALVITFFLIGICGIFMTPFSQNSVWWKQLYHLEENELDIVFLGSSHSYCTFIPETINDITEKKTMQIGAGSLDLVGVYYYLQEVFRVQSPDILVIEAYSFIDRDMWGDEEAIKQSRINAIEAMDWGSVRMKATVELFEPKLAIRKMIPFLDYHGNWENLEYAEKRLRYLIYPDAIYQQPSHSAYEGMMTEETIDKYKKMDRIDTKWELDTDQAQAWDRIMEFCNEKNVQVFVVMVPIYKEWRDHVDYESRHKQIKQITEESGCIFIDYNDSDLYNQLSIDESCFFNEVSLEFGNTHLNKKGSEIVSRHFAKWMKTYLTE